MTIICVDISKYQKGFDFAKFKASGGLGVIAKASEGTTIKDSSYDTFRAQALDQGLAFASYHFFRGNSQAEADWYLKSANPAEGERVVCDWEVSSIGAAAVVSFLQRIQSQRPDLQLTVYSGHVAKEQLTSKNAWLADNTSLWVCQYTSAAAPSWPTATWPQWSLWQYTDQTPAPGFSGPVDQNRFNGPDANFAAWMGPADAAPPEPEPAAVPVITISSSSPVQIKLGANVTVA